MARQPKFEEEKNKLDSVRKRIDDLVQDTEGMQHAHGGKDEYALAMLYQGFAEALREIRVVCGEEKPKEGKKE